MDRNDSPRFDRSLEAQQDVFAAGADTAEGTRTAMRHAYQNSKEMARESGHVPPPRDMPEGTTGPPVHQFGLYGALASRYMATGVDPETVNDRSISLWVELNPFRYLDREAAVEALAEYVVWKESSEDFPWTADDVRVDWLREKIREGARRAEDVDPGGWVAQAKEHAQRVRDGSESTWIRWVELL